MADPRSLPRLLAGADGPGLDAHFRRWGPMPAGGPALVDEVERAGLRGRGGAGFPTATKLRSVAAARRSIVVANGTEGEPASGKDKALLVGSPHLVLDGISLAAEMRRRRRGHHLHRSGRHRRRQVGDRSAGRT